MFYTEMDRERKINTLIGRLAIDYWAEYYVERIYDMLKDQVEVVSTDRILEQIASHMVSCGMDNIDQLLDGCIGGVKTSGGQEKFCEYMANNYMAFLQGK